MHTDDELRRTRNQSDDLGSAAIEEDDALASYPSLLVKTTTLSSYPVSAGQYYACHVSTLSGAMGEGKAGLASDGTAVLLVYVAGSAVPPSGTPLIARKVGGRWAARYQ